MVRYKATISYDGTLFSGFQRQPNARSIQEELENTDKISHDGNLSENSPEIKLYSLILEIIENKDLTSEERTTLKEFLDSQISNIKNNEALVARIQNVCNN